MKNVKKNKYMTLQNRNEIQECLSKGVPFKDLDFRRFLLRGKLKGVAELLLFSLALNLLRFHHKIQFGCLGSDLVVPKSFAAGL